MAVENDDRERLGLVYAEMSDGELQRIASEGAELTDIARLALAREIEHRGLDIRLALYPAGEEPDLQELVTLGRFMGLPEALLAKCTLESAGIECHLVDDEMVRLNWHLIPILGGVKLQVRPEDVDVASDLLKQPVLEDPDLDEASALDDQPTADEGPISE